MGCWIKGMVAHVVLPHKGDLSEFGRWSYFQLWGLRSEDIGVRWKMVSSRLYNQVLGRGLMGSQVSPGPPLADPGSKFPFSAKTTRFLGNNNPGGSRAPRLTHAMGPTGPMGAPLGPCGPKGAHGGPHGAPWGPKGRQGSPRGPKRPKVAMVPWPKVPVTVV